MRDHKFLHLSHTKKVGKMEQEPNNQSHSSLDKLDKKNISSKLHVAQKRPKELLFKLPQEQKYQEGRINPNHEEWPSSNKRRYLKHYHLPKITSPLKLKKEEISKYEEETNENLEEDQEKLFLQKKSVTLEPTSPTKIRLAPIKATTYAHIIRTKAGTNGKQTKINQDIAIVEQKLPHSVKLFCICDGHGTNGHLATALIKTNLIKNLMGPLKKHHTLDKESLVEIIYIAIQNTNQQLLDSDINTQLAGSTFVAVFIYQDKMLCFNIGDSRAILLQQFKTNYSKEDENDLMKLPQLSHKKSHEEYQWRIVPLSSDQKPDRPDQLQRIIKFGGRVFAQKNEQGEELGPVRVWMKDVMMPGLAMSRSMGDKAGIKAGTNAQPELLEHTIEQSDKLLVIASDGIWQYLQNDDVMKAVVPSFLKDDLIVAADTLLRKSVEAWTKMNYARDDISFIIVKIHPPEK